MRSWRNLSAIRAVAYPSRSSERAHLDDQRSWLTVHRLPAYAPELNPVEGVWAWFKGTVAANLCPDGFEPLRPQIRCGCRRLHYRPDLLQGFVHKAGLSFDSFITVLYESL